MYMIFFDNKAHVNRLHVVTITTWHVQNEKNDYLLVLILTVRRFILLEYPVPEAIARAFIERGLVFVRLRTSSAWS